jgi:serine/threonine protein kinase
MDLQAGQRLEHYVLQRRIGSGGMGTVWAALDSRSQTAVALKVLNVEHGLQSGARTRLRREAHATRSVVHPAIVPVMEVLDCEGSPVLVMELLVGETLRDLLRRESCLPLERVAGLLLPIAQALERAHASGVVHRDLKPENVFIQAPGNGGSECVRLLDFGVARFYEPPVDAGNTLLTGVGAIVGTVAYMAPEQACRPAEVDHRVDVWALGVILYEALSGCRPIEGVSDNDTLRQLLVGCITPIQIISPELPNEVGTLIDAMLSRNPERRPGNLADVCRLLRSHAASN